MFKTVTALLLAIASFAAATSEVKIFFPFPCSKLPALLGQLALITLDTDFADVSGQQTAPNVKVELYFEAKCPGCQDFTTGPLKRLLAKPDMAAIVDLKLVSSLRGMLFSAALIPF